MFLLRKLYTMLVAAIALLGGLSRSKKNYKTLQQSMGFYTIQQKGSNGMMFDCPLCGLPSEITAVLYVANVFDGGLDARYVLECVSPDHKPIVATPSELIELREITLTQEGYNPHG